MTPKERNKLWNTKIRPQLKKRFEELGITACQVCGQTSFLSFAHRLKMRFITSEEELAMAALLCTMKRDGSAGCHQDIEGKPNMYDFITSLIPQQSSQ